MLAGLGVFAVTVSTTQRQTSTLSILGARAFFAAHSGMERAVRDVTTGGACFPSPRSFTLTGGAANGFLIELQCTATLGVSEGVDTYNVFSLSSTATLGALERVDFVRRTIRATVTDG